MQFIFEFIYFSILFFKTSFAFLINFNRHLSRIDIYFIYHISYYSCLVINVASQYRYIYLNLKNKIKFDSFNSNFQTQKLYIFSEFLAILCEEHFLK